MNAGAILGGPLSLLVVKQRTLWNISSVGQSPRLITGRSKVRGLDVPPVESEMIYLSMASTAKNTGPKSGGYVCKGLYDLRDIVGFDYLCGEVGAYAKSCDIPISHRGEK